MTQVESGDLPLLTPPSTPEPTAYENYLRLQRSRRFWHAIREARDRAEHWAEERVAEIRAGFDGLMPPHGGVTPSGKLMRVRGGVAPPALAAVVLTVTGEPSGATVPFTVRRPPLVDADHQFRFVASTTADELRDRVAVCTVNLPNAEPLSFEGTLVAMDRQGGLVVSFDEAGIPSPAGAIPLDAITLTIP
jgi:hypothetical protein